MKLFPQSALAYFEKESRGFNPILFYGHEKNLISGLIKSLYFHFKKKNDVSEIKYFDYKTENNKTLKDELVSQSFFSKINFIVVKNPQEKILKEIENIEILDNILIIVGENLRSNSKIKYFFDNHKSFISIPCYQLDKKYIKKRIDNFITAKNISIKKNAYWFLIDNISEDYLFLENELEKLSIFENSSLGLETIKKLIIQKNNTNNDNYFFSCATGNQDLVLKSLRGSSFSLNESYEILFSLKRFIDLLSTAVVNKENYDTDNLIKQYLPKYLFLKKEIFKEILKKIDLKKVGKINFLLQKTEYLIRKNSEQHKEVLERFLLNLTKIMK